MSYLLATGLFISYLGDLFYLTRLLGFGGSQYLFFIVVFKGTINLGELSLQFAPLKTKLYSLSEKFCKLHTRSHFYGTCFLKQLIT